MYYEENIINGVLHWRNNPKGEWIAKTPEQLTERIKDLVAQIEFLQARVYDKRSCAY